MKSKIKFPTHRVALQAVDGQRFRCRAVVARFGTKPGYQGRTEQTILLKNVTNVANGKLMTDHLWFTCGKWSDGLFVGSIIEFDARSAAYLKGYQGRREVYDAPISEDWKLQRPTKVMVLSPPVETPSTTRSMVEAERVSEERSACLG